MTWDDKTWLTATNPPYGDTNRRIPQAILLTKNGDHHKEANRNLQGESHKINITQCI